MVTILMAIVAPSGGRAGRAGEAEENRKRRGRGPSRRKEAPAAGRVRAQVRGAGGAAVAGWHGPSSPPLYYLYLLSLKNDASRRPGGALLSLECGGSRRFLALASPQQQEGGKAAGTAALQKEAKPPAGPVPRKDPRTLRAGCVRRSGGPPG